MRAHELIPFENAQGCAMFVMMALLVAFAYLAVAPYVGKGPKRKPPYPPTKN